jgi:DNA-binding NarL/FixJ family response regulator
VGGEHRILACAEAGASGYVPHDASLEELLTVVQAVAQGELLCSPRMAASLFRRLAALASAGTGRDHQVVGTLTDREREITLLLERQLSNKDIARTLHIEVATVKNHVHNILHKLGVATRTEAAARLRAAPATFHTEAGSMEAGGPPGMRG